VFLKHLSHLFATNLKTHTIL